MLCPASGQPYMSSATRYCPECGQPVDYLPVRREYKNEHGVTHSKYIYVYEDHEGTLATNPWIAKT